MARVLTVKDRSTRWELWQRNSLTVERRRAFAAAHPDLCGETVQSLWKKALKQQKETDPVA